MEIGNYMTVTEAITRWNISKYKLYNKLSNKEIVNVAIDNKILKKFEDKESSKEYWVISKKFMEYWFGFETKI